MRKEIEELIADYENNKTSGRSDDFDDGWDAAVRDVIEDLKLILALDETDS